MPQRNHGRGGQLLSMPRSQPEPLVSSSEWQRPGRNRTRAREDWTVRSFTNTTVCWNSVLLECVMIQQQVHLQLPCYDFCPVQATAIKLVLSEKAPRGAWTPVPKFLEMAQSRAATGGVYKGQGRNQRELMTRTYLEFLVHGE